MILQFVPHLVLSKIIIQSLQVSSDFMKSFSVRNEHLMAYKLVTPTFFPFPIYKSKENKFENWLNWYGNVFLFRVPSLPPPSNETTSLKHSSCKMKSRYTKTLCTFFSSPTLNHLDISLVFYIISVSLIQSYSAGRQRMMESSRKT